MSYTDEMKQLIKRVEETRSHRLAKRMEGWEFKRVTLAEKEERLRKYHPSYKDGALQELKVGPSKGYRIPPELCNILESWSRVNPDLIDLSKVDFETDVLIIGGGGAGTAAALLAQEQGARVMIATKLRHGDANTMMAEGGIQVSSQVGKDSPYYHYLDTIGGGHFANVPEIVYTLVTQAPSVLQWLERLGAMFDKNPDGSYKVYHLGGTSRKRVHVASDITGAEIMRTLRDEARNRDQIKVLEFSAAVEIVLNEHGHCAGAILYNMETEEYHLVKAKTVILAVGQTAELGYLTEHKGIKVQSGRVEADQKDLSTGEEGIFAGGDVVTGPASIIQAIAQGRKAAAAVDQYLGGDGNIEEILAKPEKEVRLPEFTGDGRPRSLMPLLKMEERSTGFGQVERGFTDEQIADETNRCLNCDARRFEVVLNTEYCKECGYCAEVCGVNTFAPAEFFNAKGYRPQEVKSSKWCVGCFKCYFACPDFAIDVREVGA